MRIRTLRRNLATLVASIVASVTAIVAVAGCGVGHNTNDPMDVVAGFYPLAYIADVIGGNHARVTDLTGPGERAHELRLSPDQVNHIADADLVVYLKGMQHPLDKAVMDHNHDRGYTVADSRQLRHGVVPNGAGDALPQDAAGRDPHLWLDPVRFGSAVSGLTKRFGQIEPEHGKQFAKRGALIRAKLQVLDQDFADGLKNCRKRTFVSSHNAFGYLADRYHLTQLPITGLDPTRAPSSERIAEVERLMKSNQTATIFTDAGGDSRTAAAAATVAKDTGASTATLDTLETAPANGKSDYFTRMRANLKALRTTLQCS